MPQSCALGKTQAPGPGLPASRMHQVSARTGCASRMKATNTPVASMFPKAICVPLGCRAQTHT